MADRVVSLIVTMLCFGLQNRGYKMSGTISKNRCPDSSAWRINLETNYLEGSTAIPSGVDPIGMW
jgi:hypothetical protein